MKFPRQASNRKDFDAKEITNFGFAAGRPLGVSLGYSKAKIVSMPPDGRVYLDVHSAEQFEDAERLIRELEKVGIGVVYSEDGTNQRLTKK